MYQRLSYYKARDEVYFDLLRLAKVKSIEVETNSLKVIEAINQAVNYEISHKRILSLLKAKSEALNVYEKLNTDVKSMLSKANQVGVITELASRRQLEIIIQEFSTNNIPIILLKGAAFSGLIYSESSPRTSNDLDILVEERHWNEAVSLIKKHMIYKEKLTPDVFGDFYEITLVPKSKIGTAVDLHKSLVSPLMFNINEDELWKHSLMHPTFNNENVRVLSPEHSLIHQALHAFKDMDFSKYNMVDTFEIINQLKPDFDKLVEMSFKYNAATPVYILLKNNIEIMELEIDKHALNKLKPNILYRIMAKLLLTSLHNQPINGDKTMLYRINQILSLFIFSGCIVKPTKIMIIYFKTIILNKLNCFFYTQNKGLK